MEISVLGFKFRIEILILIVVIYFILFGHTLFGCSNLTCSSIKLEAFTGAGSSINEGDSAKYSLGNYDSVNTSNWGMPNLSVTQGKPYSKGVQNIMNRKKQQLPLPKDEMLMFANTDFKPECCPNAYSNSSGCACMTPEQYNYLITRSGNNVPYSEY